MEPARIHLTIDFANQNADELLAEWRWLVPADKLQPIQLTKFGDWFMADRSSNVFFLDLIEGELKKVASSFDEYNQLKNTSEKRSEWFLDGFVFGSHSKGLVLKEGECYGWRVHPKIGGKFELANVQIFSLRVYQSLMGQILRQWKQLRPGDPIPPIKISENQ